jgi:DNA-binding PadR family transcriptional regulator
MINASSLTLETLPPHEFVLLYLHQKLKSAPTANQLRNYLRNYTFSNLNLVLQELVDQGFVEVVNKKRYQITPAGHEQAIALLGEDRDLDWKKICTIRLPLQILGYDPDSPDVSKKFMKSAQAKKNNINFIRHGLLANVFQLASPHVLTLKDIENQVAQHCTEPDISQLQRLNILAGTTDLSIARVLHAFIMQLFNGLTSNKMDDLARAMINHALRSYETWNSDSAETQPSQPISKPVAATQPQPSSLSSRSTSSNVSKIAASTRKNSRTAKSAPSVNQSRSVVHGSSAVAVATASVIEPEVMTENDDLALFAQRVLTVAKPLKTPPYRGKVDIAQVYDAYCKIHRDADKLINFKRRLLHAAKERHLDLERAGILAHLPDARRSAINWNGDNVHLVVVEWI